MRITTILVTSSLIVAALVLAGELPPRGLEARQAVKKVDMGDYEPVVP